MARFKNRVCLCGHEDGWAYQMMQSNVERGMKCFLLWSICSVGQRSVGCDIYWNCGKDDSRYCKHFPFLTTTCSRSRYRSTKYCVALVCVLFSWSKKIFPLLSSDHSVDWWDALVVLPGFIVLGPFLWVRNWLWWLEHDQSAAQALWRAVVIRCRKPADGFKIQFSILPPVTTLFV